VTSDVITENSRLSLSPFSLTVLANLGQRGQIRYFKVRVETETRDTPQDGLLRIGSAQGLLQQELQLRDTLGDYGLIAPLLAQSQISDLSEILQLSQDVGESYLSEEDGGDSLASVEPESEDSEFEDSESKDSEFEDSEFEDSESEDSQSETEGSSQQSQSPEPESVAPESVAPESVATEEESEYLEDEYYPEEPLPGDEGDRLLLLTAFPQPDKTLAQWLERSPSLKDTLTAIAQICQLFWYIHQQHWCMVDLDPDWLEMGQPLRCFDLTCAYPEETPLTSGRLGTYCAPELSAQPIPNEASSTYTIGALLYHALSGEYTSGDRPLDPKPCAIPYLSQLLSLSLTPISDERFSLAQFRSLLIETRNRFNQQRLHWEIASDSTVGLSPRRLHNEDHYGVAQLDEGTPDNQQLLAALADGMGGMAQGEVASQLAIETVFQEWRSQSHHFSDNPSQHLESLLKNANSAISQAVPNGGTTLSLIFAQGRHLSLAHVGDSRIYLLRKQDIQQLSEDHSLVALLVASGEISLEESYEHPDRNVLTKSLGSKQQLSRGYIQTQTDLTLEDGDILVLCSDGVWDLVPDRELQEQFSPSIPLHSAVQTILDTVLKRGAIDNATLIAARCRFHPQEFVPSPS
jgi:protein phosphatase